MLPASWRAIAVHAPASAPATGMPCASTTRPSRFPVKEYSISGLPRESPSSRTRARRSRPARAERSPRTSSASTRTSPAGSGSSVTRRPLSSVTTCTGALPAAPATAPSRTSFSPASGSCEPAATTDPRTRPESAAPRGAADAAPGASALAGRAASVGPAGAASCEPGAAASGAGPACAEVPGVDCRRAIHPPHPRSRRAAAAARTFFMARAPTTLPADPARGGAASGARATAQARRSPRCSASIRSRRRASPRRTRVLAVSTGTPRRAATAASGRSS